MTPIPPLYTVPVQEYAERLQAAREQLRQSDIPVSGVRDTDSHIKAITHAIPRGTAPTYFGFVTGGVTPEAARADHLVTEIDANLHVHLPDVSIATDIEDTALRWLLQLFRLRPEDWRHRIFTTGATASNVLGLACGRDYVVQEAARRKGLGDVSVAELGLAGALQTVGKRNIQIITSMPHSSLRKAASIVGLGRDAVQDVALGYTHPDLHVTKVEELLVSSTELLSIVVVSCGEVNTGRFATDGTGMKKLKNVCDEYGAWLHVDAAFGLPARILDKTFYPELSEGVEGLDLADSVSGDAHKLLNVPYDCGIFFSKHPRLGFSVFQNAGAAYLNSNSSGDGDSILSPLNIGIENSRRFRALPVYASLRAYGREGYRDILQRQIALSRRVAKFILAHEAYSLLPESENWDLGKIYIIVLFRAKDKHLNDMLTDSLNASKELYVSGTVWNGEKATRIAVSNWQADPDRDGNVVEKVLDAIWNKWRTANSHINLS